MGNGYTLIAPVSEDWENVYVGIRDFQIRRIVLIAQSEEIEKAKQLKKELKKFRVPVEVARVEGELFEEFFRIVHEVLKRDGRDKILINVASGDKITACIALSVAFVNGIKAFGVKDSNPMLFPVMRFSYYKLISNKKIKILGALRDGPLSLEELASTAEMSPPLLSYHIHGSSKMEGLLSLGLAELIEDRKTKLKLSILGRLLLRTYV